MWFGEMDKKAEDIQAREIFLGQNFGENEKECQVEEEAEMVTTKTSTW